MIRARNPGEQVLALAYYPGEGLDIFVAEFGGDRNQSLGAASDGGADALPAWQTPHQLGDGGDVRPSKLHAVTVELDADPGGRRRRTQVEPPREGAERDQVTIGRRIRALQVPSGAEAVVPEHGSEGLLIAFLASTVGNHAAADPELTQRTHVPHCRDGVLGLSIGAKRGAVEPAVVEPFAPANPTQPIGVVSERQRDACRAAEGAARVRCSEITDRQALAAAETK